MYLSLVFSVGEALGLLVAGGVIIALLNRITQLKSRDEALIESQARVAATINTSPDAVIVVDVQGCILEWNGGAERCFGYKREQALAKTMNTLIIPQRHWDNHEKALKAYSVQGASSVVIGRRIEIAALHADGHEFPIELAVGVAAGTGQPIFVAFVRDITNRRKYEADLQAAVALAENGSRSKANFLAVMSHEMRTPLNGVIGTLDLLARTQLMSEQRQLVDTALQSGELLLAQINDVLDISKMDADKLTLDEVPFDVVDMIGSVLDIVRPQAIRQGNLLTLDIADGTPRNVVGDQIRLRQISLNLISNAVKFTTKGSVSIFVRSLSLDCDKVTLEFAIKDTGIGIDQCKLGDLFQDFSMIDSSYSRRSGGTGLGLAISKRLVQAMGGQISVSSQPGSGSVFWFKVRMGVATETLLVAADTETVPSADIELQPLKILLVEDNLTNLMVAHRMLSVQGHQVITATDGNEGVQAATVELFDVILMDISMPELDGLEAAKRIRALPGRRGNVPIIAMTAHALQGDRERFLEAGMSDYVSKPVRLNQLMGSIARVARTMACSSSDKSTPAHNAARTETLKLINRGEIENLAAETGPDMIPLICRQFLVELESRGRDMVSALDGQSGELLRKAAHALTGLGATLGADRMTYVMRNIEGACIAGNLIEAFAQSANVRQLLADTSSAYRSFLSAWSPQRSFGEIGPPDPEWIDESKVSLADFVRSVATDEQADAAPMLRRMANN